VKRFLRNNGLSIVLFLLFAISFAGHSGAGFSRHNEEQLQHGKPALGYFDYLASAHFLESVFENWESEFLQMALFVVLTAWLYQKGSAESNELPGERRADKPIKAEKIPRAARAGGLTRVLYEHSLSLALFLLFAGSVVAHALSGCRAFNAREAEHGRRAIGVLQYMGSSQFWFESFQNWQSEFLSIGVIVVLTIWLREKGSTQSKKVDAPHSETGH
jgi:hypothetical protein